MTLPISMDPLLQHGVLDVDPNAFLNAPVSGKANGNQYLLGGAQMPGQPQRDSFSSKAKEKLTDTNFLKKAATAVIATVLVAVGVKKGANLCKSVKNGSAWQSICNAGTSVINGVKGLFTKVSK